MYTNRSESDIEIDNELKRYITSLLSSKTPINILNIDSVVDGKVSFISWVKYPVENNFMIFNMILNINSSDKILRKKEPIKNLIVDKNVIPLLIFEYVSYCDKNGVIIKNSNVNFKND